MRVGKEDGEIMATHSRALGLSALFALAQLAPGCVSSSDPGSTVADRCDAEDYACREAERRWWRRYSGPARRGQGTQATGGSCPGGVNQPCSVRDMRAVPGNNQSRSSGRYERFNQVPRSSIPY